MTTTDNCSIYISTTTSTKTTRGNPCLSTWGNDFRHDYFYIAQFIKKLIDQKYNQSHIPISCFTATANKKTIEDIEKYFYEHLEIRFNHYIASPRRTNLKFKATQHQDKKEKNKALVEHVRHIKEPLLIYNPSSRMSTAELDSAVFS